MVTVIVYGLVAGVALSAIRGTRNIGFLVLAIVGVLFIVTSVGLLLGGLISSLLPLLVIAGVIYGIYYFAVNKGKPKNQGNESNSNEVENN